MITDGLHQLRSLSRSRKAQGLADLVGVDGPHRRRRALVQQAHRVAHTAVSQPCQIGGGVRLQGNVLAVGDIVQPVGDVLRQDPAEGKALAAGQDGRGHLVQLRGRQDKQQMLRRLLDDLQQRIKGTDGQHMDLVDDINPLFDLGGRIDRVVPQGAHIVHTVIGGGVDLQHIHAGAGVDAFAGGAAITGVSVHGMLTVDRLGKNFCTGGLARASGTGEQIGVAQAVVDKLVFQRLGHSKLTDHIVKGLGPVFSV